MNNMKKNIILSIIVIFVGLAIASGTFAWLTGTLTVTDGNYSAMSDCFLIDYNINNSDNTQDITGTMFPTSNASKGLNGRVGLKVNSSCNTYGTGTIKLHVDNTTSSTLTTPIASYCESKKTLQKIDGISTKETCETANGIWRGYGDSYCENPTTLERITTYTTQSDCNSNGGSWTTGGSPLKYALYYNEYALGTPLSVGHITTADIGHDITLKDDAVITDSQDYYYIYVWLDGYMTDNTFANLSFSGSISASVIQNNEANTNAYTVTFDANGGTVDIPSKTVVYGENYGTLPTPTRSGYTFLGWKGKNLFDKSEPWLNAYFNKNSNNSIYFLSDGSTMYKIPCEGNKTYTISYDFNIVNSIFRTAYVTVNKISNETVVYQFESTANQPHTLTTNSSATYIVIQIAGGARDDVANTLQVEEGTNATEWEPYYITSSTRVVKNQNHTLTAKWEQNIFTVTLDAYGGLIPATTGWTVTGSSATKQVVYGSEYGTLPTPTKEGYRFLGWKGKNLFDKSEPWLNAWFNKNFDNSIYFVSDGSTMYKIPCEANKTYTISYDFNIINSIFRTAYVTVNEISSGTVVYQFESTVNQPHTLTTGSSATYIVIQVAGGVRDDVANTLQVEEGTIATEWEPYYITSSTRVVKNNHTLKAIWEAN